MKKIIILLLAFTLSSGWAANKIFVAPVIPDEAREIDKHISSYQMKSKEILGLSLKGGKIDYFYDKKTLVKARAEFYGEMGSSSDDFYFRDGQIIFICSVVNHFDKPGGMVISKNLSFYYFNHGKMIKWIKENRNMKPHSSAFNNIESNLIESINQYMDVSKLSYPCVDLNGEKISPCKPA